MKLKTLAADEGIRKYFSKDFHFINQYIFDFSQELAIAIKHEMDLFYKKTHIATFSLAVPDERMRLYKVIFHPEFTAVPEEVFSGAIDDRYNVFPEFKLEPNSDYSVTIGPELLHLWCHKLVWEAVEVLDYKILH